MRNMKKLLVAGVALAGIVISSGCKSDCEKAYDNVIKVMEADKTIAASEDFKKMKTDAEKKKALEECKKEKPEQIKCVIGAKDMAAIMACTMDKAAADAAKAAAEGAAKATEEVNKATEEAKKATDEALKAADEAVKKVEEAAPAAPAAPEAAPAPAAAPEAAPAPAAAPEAAPAPAAAPEAAPAPAPAP